VYFYTNLKVSKYQYQARSSISLRTKQGGLQSRRFRGRFIIFPKFYRSPKRGHLPSWPSISDNKTDR